MGSICRPLECFMIAFLALNKEEVNFNKTVSIGHLHVERNLRSRRRLVADICGYQDCNQQAVASGIYLPQNMDFFLCRLHFRKAKTDPNWSFPKTNTSPYQVQRSRTL